MAFDDDPCLYPDEYETDTPTLTGVEALPPGIADKLVRIVMFRVLILQMMF